ncbi:DUF551 domain-containing protein [Escherichia coli]|nr:DUF551 domain-containing protein [Escherichia coli]
MTTITKERLLTIKQWRETYGPGSNVVLPAEEAEELARVALTSLEAEPVAWECGENIILFNPDTVEAYAKRAEISPKPLYAAPPVSVTPDGWISCSERMPNDKQYVWCWGKSYGWTECDTFEGYYDWSRNKWWAVTDNEEEQASKVTHWMPLPEPPQEVNRG